MDKEYKRKIEVDISGQIQQINYDSALGFKRWDNLQGRVFLKSDTKKAILKKYKGQVTNLIEKVHCIMIYYAIKDFVRDINEIVICKDVDFRRVSNFLPLLFKKCLDLNNLKIKYREGLEDKSGAYRISLKIFRNKKYANLIVTKEMIENVLFEFKK